MSIKAEEMQNRKKRLWIVGHFPPDYTGETSVPDRVHVAGGLQAVRPHPLL